VDFHFLVLILSIASFRPPSKTKRGRRGIPPLEPLLPRRPSGTLTQASACPIGQNAETKFSSSLIEKRKWTRANQKSGRKFC